MSDVFPLEGVAGIVATEPAEVEAALEHGLRAVEVRADLLLDGGASIDAVMDTVRRARELGLACLFTLRHPTHGGRFQGSEPERVAINRRALEAGAQVIDLEWRTEAARTLLAEGAPVLLSQHDFDAMIDAPALAALTRDMEAAGPLGIKVVPTGTTLGDAAAMLSWVAAAPAAGPRRIGFTMGAAGACSRILCIAYGSPISYASFGAAVAPGQVALAELTGIYRAHELNASTRVYGIAGSAALGSFSPFLHNPSFHARGINAVYVPLQTDAFADLCAHLDDLRIDGMSVTNPFKGEAVRFADAADGRSQGAGAANTLVVTRGPGGRQIHAYNTDFDGVTIPIGRHRALPGLKVAVVGNGGAARGAVVALADAGAQTTLFYRNLDKGAPVAAQLGVPGAPLADIDASFDVYVNATTLGSQAGDPSPVPAAVFSRPQQVAFDMCYQQPTSRFLDDAAAAGASLVRGGEMLVAQGTVQFLHFSGQEVPLDEFEQNFARVSRYR